MKFHPQRKRCPFGRAIISVTLFLFVLLTVCETPNVLGNDPPTPIPDAEALNSTVREYPDGHYVLTGDIYLNGSYSPWLPIGSRDHPFKGTLDGNDHFVYGLFVNTTNEEEPAGLFGAIVDSHIHNLILVRTQIESHSHNSSVGAIAGLMEWSNLNDCLVTGLVYAIGGYVNVGAVVGLAHNNSCVSNILVTGDVLTVGVSANIGGVVGLAQVNSHVSSVLANGDVRGEGKDNYIGGMVGRAENNSFSNNALVTGNVSGVGNHTDVGGVVGAVQSKSSVSNVLTTRDVYAEGNSPYAGGVVGVATNSFVDNALSTGYVRATGRLAVGGGGAIGAALDSPVSNLLITADVRSDALAGGAVGYSHGTSPISNLLVTGDVRGVAPFIGGVVGVVDICLTAESATFFLVVR